MIFWGGVGVGGCIEAPHLDCGNGSSFLDSIEIMPINMLVHKFDGTVVSIDDLCSLFIYLIVKEKAILMKEVCMVL